MKTICTQRMDKHSHFFREICSPGDDRLSKLKKKFWCIAFATLFQKVKIWEQQKGVLTSLRHIATFLLKPALCFEGHVQVRLKF